MYRYTAYLNQLFPKAVIEACPELYSAENAKNWINFEKFSAFVAKLYQNSWKPSVPVTHNLSFLPNSVYLFIIHSIEFIGREVQPNTRSRYQYIPYETTAANI
jgi:hypothetical protein